MLGRTACLLYWMARSMERAENMARLLEVGYRISLMPQAIEGHRDEWRSTLQAAGCFESFAQRHGSITAAAVIDFLLFDEANPSSVHACLWSARDNGRAVRTALTRDVWGALNATWNEWPTRRRRGNTPERLPVLLDWIRGRAMLFRGAIVSTMLHNDVQHFCDLGTFVERADNTARILDVKYYILLPRPQDVGSDLDMQQWLQLLRSVSAHRSYRWQYPNSQLLPWNIAEFLILKREMPRSLISCYQAITDALEGLARVYGRRYPVHRQAGDIHARLQTVPMDEIFQSGLHEFLQAFIADNNRLSHELASTYNFS